MHSDNGTTFVGVNNDLRLFLAHESVQEKIYGFSANEGIEWNFIPPRGPHFFGLWDAGIKSAKAHMKRVIGNSLLTFEEMNTLLCQIEACLNSRTLCPLSEDPDSLSLIPGHFFIGESLIAVPEPSVLHTPTNRLNRWQYVQQLQQSFWELWTRDYLHQLQQRTSWMNEQPNLQARRLVLLKEGNLPSMVWRRGLVQNVYRGPSGLVRVADVKPASGVLKRPISKFCLLPNN
jgi:hypothetical protein